MKVINYGPGWEPKILTCGSCKSELEYTDLDIKSNTYSDYECCPVGTKDYVVCPVCGMHNVIKEVYYD